MALMKEQHRLINDIDLTFGDIIISETEDQVVIPENLRPTEAMQARFMQNCLKEGILTTI